MFWCDIVLYTYRSKQEIVNISTVLTFKYSIHEMSVRTDLRLRYIEICYDASAVYDYIIICFIDILCRNFRVNIILV